MLEYNLQEIRLPAKVNCADIREWWENGDSATLITRPGRFGKTLAMSMTERFFSSDYADRSDLFEGLSVGRGYPE